MKTTTVAVIAGLALCFGTSLATAHPTTQTKKHTNKKLSLGKAKMHLETPAQDDFFDDFESYKVGSDIVGQGGWEGWYSGGEHAIVSDDHGTNSLKDHVLSDIVQRFTAEDGKWTFSAMTYAPSAPDAVGEGYIILMDAYGDDLSNHWAVQIRFDPTPQFNVVESQFDGATLPLITDEWVELRCEIDLDADTNQIFYGGQLLSEHAWTEGVNGGGQTSIACVDLFSLSLDPMYYDNVTLKAAGGGECYPDFDGNGLLDLFDFLGFQNAFVGKDPKADCEANGIFDLFDFLCYQNAFVKGC